MSLLILAAQSPLSLFWNAIWLRDPNYWGERDTAEKSECKIKFIVKYIEYSRGVLLDIRVCY